MTTVRGQVVDGAGRPIAGVPLELTAQGWFGSVWRARSGADGWAVFELPPMRAGAAGTLSVSAPRAGAMTRTTVGAPFVLRLREVSDLSSQ